MITPILLNGCAQDTEQPPGEADDTADPAGDDHADETDEAAGAAPADPEDTGGQDGAPGPDGDRCASPLRGEAQLISPFGSWQALGPWTAGFTAAPGADVTLPYRVAVPADARPGAQWWALVKVMYFGRARYSPAIPIIVTS